MSGNFYCVGDQSARTGCEYRMRDLLGDAQNCLDVVLGNLLYVALLQQKHWAR